jgi:hypothetical protein
VFFRRTTQNLTGPASNRLIFCLTHNPFPGIPDTDGLSYIFGVDRGATVEY